MNFEKLFKMETQQVRFSNLSNSLCRKTY